MEYLIEYIHRGEKKNKTMKDGPLFDNFCNSENVIITKVVPLDPSNSVMENQPIENGFDDLFEEW